MEYKKQGGKKRIPGSDFFPLDKNFYFARKSINKTSPLSSETKQV